MWAVRYVNWCGSRRNTGALQSPLPSCKNSRGYKRGKTVCRNSSQRQSENSLDAALFRAEPARRPGTITGTVSVVLQCRAGVISARNPSDLRYGSIYWPPSCSPSQ
ncbi:hypothetical protein NDU88_001612 [Pleurodeles waltl]|uniref:Uncharacterized protein n=1 Tax=Pleurodeles waltl TaxID=8319 RepID=A0AAV7KTA7_PLEWA|nr:hypothetical protein NDU88_001612 [Pleurodeles waltl]